MEEEIKELIKGKKGRTMLTHIYSHIKEKKKTTKWKYNNKNKEKLKNHINK